MEGELLLVRVLILFLLYAFVGAVGWIAWLELRAGPARSGPRLPEERFIVLDGGDTGWPPGTALPVAAVTIVGRDLAADVALQDDTLSGRHASVVHRDGDWWLEDLHSTNGTYLNGERLGPEAPALMRSGDVVQFGGVRARWVEPDA